MKSKIKTILGAIGIGASSLSLMALGYGLHKTIMTDKINDSIKKHRNEEILAGRISNKLDCMIWENEYEPELLQAVEDDSALYYRKEYAEQQVIKALEDLK